MAKPILLLVDNDARDLVALTSALTVRYSANYVIWTASTAAEALMKVVKAGASLDLIIASHDVLADDQQDLFDRALVTSRV